MNLKPYSDLLLLAGLLTDQASLVPLTDSAAQSLSFAVTAVVALTGSEVMALVVVGLLRSGLAAMLRRDYLRLDQAVAVLTDLAATRPTDDSADEHGDAAHRLGGGDALGRGGDTSHGFGGGAHGLSGDVAHRLGGGVGRMHGS
ncbi:hypothetical protein PC129_g23084 [Phytophthora cactorum]|uniref:Uncharacterized protein n=1 Tax=Phytophthora cactorum TaxID=29920 RepID=A0A8T0ZIL5_9STRA|nr:hypothetical protein Pcac1_g22728 [Phytophthora cactorum]KAG2837318.1 hypothetical protein PC111_g4710 [Phytophthora cactorum]KAG2844095.1 hypothetical protein PC112_g2378 [Phytophthora cactorum]KAG2862860.1 hypothetical protein PC113_g5896 [Phytophthora cactorum]KAG2877121.1 hypothetical protein PC115_g23442 [Phytophthora cactorum]